MKEEIKNILIDLYRIDETLKNHEAELVKIIEKLLLSKPDTKFDQEFYLRLKDELRQMNISEKPIARKVFWQTIFFQRTAYALAGAAAMLIIILPIVFRDNLNLKSFIADNQADQKIAAKLAAGAFGHLAGVERGGGGLAENSPAAKTSTGLGAGSSEPAASKMSADASIMPIFNDFKYVYKGDEFTLEGGNVEVLRRIKGRTVTTDAGDILDNSGLNLLDTGNLKKVGLNNIDLIEDRPFGYIANFDFRENIASIYSNWEKWPHPENACGDDQSCYDSYRLKKSDMLDDEEAIMIADKFLSDYGIDRSAYGEPQVDHSWEEQGGVIEAERYYPDEISVSYPLLVNGEEVYGSYGNKVSLNVGVNNRYKKVASVYSLTKNKYESSEYEAVNDVAAVISLAESGGSRPLYARENTENAKVVTVELGSPHLAMLQYYQYLPQEDHSDELYVPALVFPVTNVSDKDAYFNNKNVVIPLVKEIFDENNKALENVPMPLLRGEEPMIKTLDATENNAVENSVKGE